MATLTWGESEFLVYYCNIMAYREEIVRAELRSSSGWYFLNFKNF